MVNPRATNEDLTAKARIRNAALDLYSKSGPDRISLRTIASEAGVTLGLVQHHYKSKAGLRAAVDQLVVDYFAAALATVPDIDRPSDLAAARDSAVRQMLEENPAVVNYVRRAILDPSGENLHLLDVLVELTAREVSTLRKAGRASTKRRESTQVVAVLVRQMGEMLLAPLVDAVWDRVDGSGAERRPRLRITVEDS
ncbi:TetR family transcriptional regulator [Mycolicibacterium conceptionense]|uniref:TetR family transcriptional regulator n=2 Tax=Mycolicibacterium TaxID=1866885 RepID=A0A1A1XM60_9MYCO|nr:MULTISPECIES: TetR/AcrR family transcriptional regulator [Mycolicibacterium]MCW1824275.1 TetR/AcrR family transcriptional regulator [Mycolicibacterium senegalense]OBB06078.1 TetR family transcriptional regulator [Mycolicibacterium conceptionense]OBF02211.1 TetR family transcriptional regulator [Mycolicibacterium conceptionense]OBF20228.1 TetR family transcriptional regulator [Mycolicibacterium conceptionense]OBF47952.1 TetR family transcriptional regulator [Mycolicibacterium conceptionense]